jgi:ureidoacrylate peracid hydrolase
VSSTNDAPLNAAHQLAHVPMLSTLDAKVDPKHTALVVVDVLNDFCAEGGMMDKEGQDISTAQRMAARLPRLIQAARDAGVLVVFVRNVYSSDRNTYLSDVWLEQAARRRAGSYTEREVCARDSWEGEFYGDVRPLPGEAIVIKHRFSAFTNTDLDTILRAHGIRTMVMSGVASNVCVETTAREGFCRDYYIVYLSDGTSAYHEHDHAAALRAIDLFFGQVVTIDDVVEVWQGEGAELATAGSAASAE